MNAEKVHKESARVETADSLKERIRKRAYEIYLARKGRPGSEVKDWLQAEAEIMWKLSH